MKNREKLLAIIEKAQVEKSLAEKQIKDAERTIIYADAKIEVANEMLKEDEVEVCTEAVVAEENI